MNNTYQVEQVVRVLEAIQTLNHITNYEKSLHARIARRADEGKDSPVAERDLRELAELTPYLPETVSIVASQYEIKTLAEKIVVAVDAVPANALLNTLCEIAASYGAAAVAEGPFCVVSPLAPAAKDAFLDEVYAKLALPACGGGATVATYELSYFDAK